MSDHYDAIIIGMGQAGPALAGRLAAAGQSVAIIERHLPGGTCVNTGCTPTKTLVASARVAWVTREAARFGIQIGGTITVDFPAVMARKNRVVDDKRDGLIGWLDGMEGCRVVHGHARFVSPNEIEVNGQTLQARRIYINVGGRAAIPDMPGVDTVPYLTNTSILELDVLPEHLLIVGGSYIGLEFAQIFRRLGSQVTVVERSARLLPHEDEDVCAALKALLEAEGIVFHLGAECISLAAHEQGVAVGLGHAQVSGSHVLLAMGRRPNTDSLALDRAGVATDKRGYIVVDDELRTTVPHIWALGDCNGKGAFTHTAYNDFEIVAENLLDAASRRVSDRIPAYALFVDPPLGRVGLSEAEAHKAGHRIRVGKRPMTRVARAVEKGETHGFMKIIVDADTDLILGATLLGVEGDEAVHGIADLMYARASWHVLREAVHIHPTVSELIPTLLAELQTPG